MDLCVILLLFTPTTVAGVKHFVASVILCVCPHDKTKSTEIKITKLGTGIVCRESLPHQLKLGQKVTV